MNDDMKEQAKSLLFSFSPLRKGRKVAYNGKK